MIHTLKIRAALPLIMLIGILAPGEHTIYAQNKSQCLQTARSIYKKLGLMPKDNMVYRTRYTVSSTMRNIKASSDMEISMYVSRGKQYCISRQMETYQDSTMSVMVVPQQKIIQVGDPAKLGDRSKDFALLQDSVMARSSVQSCEDYMINSSVPGTKLILRLDEKSRRHFHVETMTLYFSSDAIHKASLEYSSDNPLARVDFVFHEMNFDSRKDFDSRTVRSMFLDRNGQLLDKYDGYQFRDVRMQSTH